MNILIVCNHFYPHNRIAAFRLNAFARYFREAGHSVTVITEGDRDETAMWNGCEVHYVKDPVITSSKQDSLLQRRKKWAFRHILSALQFRLFLDYKRIWQFKASKKAQKLAKSRRFDVVLSSYGHLSSHRIAYRLHRKTPFYWIADMRDETDLSGLKLAIDLKRGADPEQVMQKLFRLTPLCDSFACNFNILIGGMPRVMGVRELLDEWCAWRTESVKRRVYFVLKKRQDKLHLLKGLKRILLDIDKAIRIIRETEKEADVVPNLMIGFGIDQIQAEYVAEIKLRSINREYILKRVEETAALESEIEDLEDTLARPSRIRKIIITELEEVRKKYAESRRTGILYDYAEDAESEEDAIEDYPVTLFLSQHGYFKKITPQSLRMSGEQKFKEDDALSMSVESSNAAELMFFTDKAQVYKTRVSDFADGKASQLGDYLPAKLGMDEGESVMGMVLPGDYSGYMIFFFENGKAAKVELSAYKTTSNRRRLTGAYSDKSPLKALLHLKEDREIAVYSTEPRVLIVNTALLGVKTTRTTQGVALLTLKKKYVLDTVRFPEETGITDLARYRGRSIPATGALLKTEDSDDKQLSLI